KILFAWTYSSPRLSPPAGNQSHLLAWSAGEQKKLEPQRAQGSTEEACARGHPNYKLKKLQNYEIPLKCSHPPASSRRAFPSAPISRIPADCVVRPIRVTRTPAISDGTGAADVKSNS